MMKTLTIVLTITVLAAALAGKPAHAQSLPSSLAPYNQAIAVEALSADPSEAEQSLVAAVNGQRAADGVPALTWDPALAAAARYQENDDNALNFSGEEAFLADGRTPVAAPQMAQAFGSAATGVAESISASVFHPADFGNPAAMVADWRQLDPSFAAMLSSGTVNACGLSIVARYNPRSNTTSYLWAIFYGTDAAPAPAPPTAQAVVVPAGYNQAIATAAVQTAPTTLEQSLLAAVNGQRAADGVPALTWDPALAAAARYQENDDNALNFSGEEAFLADGRTPVAAPQMAQAFGSAATGVAESISASVFHPADFGNPAAMVADWRQLDPSFAAMLSSGTVNACGLSIVARYNPRSNTTSYLWAIFYGAEGRRTTPAPAPAPAPSTGSLNATIAAAARSATASADETALLAAINAYRTYLGNVPLTPDAGLTAAAHYQAGDDLALNRLAQTTTWAYLANGSTELGAAALASYFGSPAVNIGDYVFTDDFDNGAYLSATSRGWATQVTLWANSDPSGFAAMAHSGAVNACGIAVVRAGTGTQNGVSYPIKYYVLLVGRR